jgi:hypothetical protein
MNKKSLSKKIYAVGIILFLGAITVVPSLQATGWYTSSNNPVTHAANPDHLLVGNVTRHLVCFIERGDVQLRNFQGRFFGIPITTDTGVEHLGAGAFQLDLLYWDENSSEASLNIWQFHRQAAYLHDVRITVRLFVGWYQPTGDLSGGELRGFVVGLKVTPIER